jgi:hypothetical protein
MGVACQQPNWKPFFFSPFYILSIATLHVMHIVGIQLLVQKHRDDQPEIRLIQQNMTVEDPQSIFVFREDDSKPFLVWFYVPVAISTILGLFWESLDANVRRLEPFRQLSTEQGGTVWNALCLDYTSRFGLVVPVSAWRKGHYAVSLSALVFVLTTVVIPTLTGGIFNVDWASLSYSSEKTVGPKFATISVDSGVAIATQALHGLIVALGVAIAVILYRRPTGLYRDPKGIGGIVSLISDTDRSGCNTLRLFRELPSSAPSAVIRCALQHVTFQLQHVSTLNADGTASAAYQLAAHAHPGCEVAVNRSEYDFSQKRREAMGFWLTKRAVFIAEGLIWLGHATAIGAIYSIAKIVGPDGFAQRAKVTIAKIVLTLFITIGGVMWSSIQRDLQRFEPWRRLSRPPAPAVYSSLVRSDVASLGLLCSVGLSIARVSLVALWASFCVIMVQVVTIFSPPLLELLYAASFVGPTGGPRRDIGVLTGTQGLTLGATGVAIHLVTFFNLLFLIFSGRTKPFLPRAPTTIASQIAYLCRSDRLMRDFAGTSMLSKKSLAQKLQSIERKYLLGWFWWYPGPALHIGVEEYNPAQH